MNAFRTSLLSFALLAAFAAPAAAAPGDDAAHRKEAQVLFGEGVKQAEKGDTKSALASFRAASISGLSFGPVQVRRVGQGMERCSAEADVCWVGVPFPADVVACSFHGSRQICTVFGAPPEGTGL